MARELCRNILHFGIIFGLLTWPAINTHAADKPFVPRQRLHLENPDIRQLTVRMTNGPVALLLYGKIENGQYFPIRSHSALGLGATDCSTILNHVQEFPLQGMVNRGYIDSVTYERLRHSQHYLTAAQVTFYSIAALLTPTEFEEKKKDILHSQIHFGLPVRIPTEGKIPVTLGTLYLIANRILDESGLRRTPLPWMSDPVFAAQARALIPDDSDGIDFEIGRGYQVAGGYIDQAVDSALITIAHEMAVHRFPFEKSRIFVHSYKKGNTLAYLQKFPTLKVVATDPLDPENVVLMSPLTGLYSPERPWDRSGMIQKIIQVNREHLTVTKAWNLLMSARNSLRVDMNYVGTNGKESMAPIVWRTGPSLYKNNLVEMMREYGVTDIAEQERLWQIAYSESELQEPLSPLETYMDTIAGDPVFTWKSIQGATTSLSNLNPADSAQDPNYEVRVLFGAGLLTRHLSYPPGDARSMELLLKSVFSVSTTERAIAERLEKLQPSRSETTTWESDWRAAAEKGRGILQFAHTTVHTYYFNFADLNRLAKAYPDVMEQARTVPPLSQGHYLRRAVQLRPIGF